MKSFAEAGARSPGTAWDTLVQAVLSLVVGLTLWATASQAKIAGSTHCYNGVCHRVWTVEETRAAINAVQRVTASHYDSPERDRFNPRLETSSGESFHAGRADNAASPIFPDGTKLVTVHAPIR